MKINLTESTIDDICQEYEKLTLVELATKYGLSYTKIRNTLKARGIKFRKDCQRSKLVSITETPYDIIEKYQNGFSITEISNQYKCSHNVIRKFLNQSNIKIRKTNKGLLFDKDKWYSALLDSHKLTYEEEQNIVSTYVDNGWGIRRICRKFHRGDRKIHNILIKHGVKIRPPITDFDYGVSKSEKAFLDELEKIYNIKIERQFQIASRFYDGLILNTNILIEVDCEYWHKDEIENDAFKDFLAKNRGYKLYRFRVDEMKYIPKVLKKERDKIELMLSETKTK